MSPRVDEIVELAINAYEEMLRRTADAQRSLARALGFEPARSILNTTADLTRDIGAVQLAAARWLLDS